MCGAETRGRGERRGPLAFYMSPMGESWRCHAGGCNGGGGPAALLAAVRLGAVPPRGDPAWREIMAEFEPDGGRGRQGATWSAPRARNMAPGLPPARTSLPQPSYPSLDEVTALWAACRPLGTLPDVHPALAYLRGRSLDPGALDAIDLVRGLPLTYRWPSWVPRSVPRTHPLVVAMFDADGQLRSLRFRAVAAGARKTMAAGQVVGLVMADPIAQALLQGRREDSGMRWDGRVVICEGEPDWWTWATHPERGPRALADGATYATFGVVAGSWTTALAARIPDRARVVVRTHHDEPGHVYAETIRVSLTPRCAVLRGPSPSTESSDAPQAS